MRSPVIIRPMQDSKGEAASLITVLLTKPLTGVCLNLEGRFDDTRRNDEKSVRRPDLANDENSPLAGQSSTGSAVEGFISFLKREDFMEVSA